MTTTAPKKSLRSWTNKVYTYIYTKKNEEKEQVQTSGNFMVTNAENQNPDKM